MPVGKYPPLAGPQKGLQRSPTAHRRPTPRDAPQHRTRTSESFAAHPSRRRLRSPRRTVPVRPLAAPRLLELSASPDAMTTEAEVAPATVEAVMPNADAPVDAKVDKAETEVKSESKDAPKEVPKPDQPRLPKPDRAALDGVHRRAARGRGRAAGADRDAQARDRVPPREAQEHHLRLAGDPRAHRRTQRRLLNPHGASSSTSRRDGCTPTFARPGSSDLRDPRGPAGICPSEPPPRTDRAREPRPAVGGDDAIDIPAIPRISRDRRERAFRVASRDAPAFAPRRFGCLRPRQSDTTRRHAPRARGIDRARQHGEIFPL